MGPEKAGLRAQKSSYTRARKLQPGAREHLQNRKNSDSSEQSFLRHLLEDPFGLSATTPAHHNDSWVHYLRHLYMLPHLVPILDEMTWPEDIQLLPHVYGIGTSQFTLLADSDMFYFFNLDGHALYAAGTTVEVVNWGVGNGGWLSYGPLPNINGLRWVIMGRNMTPGIISLYGLGMWMKTWDQYLAFS